MRIIKYLSDKDNLYPIGTYVHIICYNNPDVHGVIRDLGEINPTSRAEYVKINNTLVPLSNILCITAEGRCTPVNFNTALTDSQTLVLSPHTRQPITGIFLPTLIENVPDGLHTYYVYHNKNNQLSYLQDSPAFNWTSFAGMFAVTEPIKLHNNRYYLSRYGYEFPEA